ncbi:MAG: BlaI/MecI/CopY family transcriptional regulator [Gemmatimonadaceae bacterium]
MKISFTDRELDVMAELWDGGPSTVAEVRERLDDDLAYNTVLTVLRTLEEKGYVGHEEEGRAYRYFPLVAREEAGSSALRRMVGKLFAGSPELLLTRLVSDRELQRDELERLRRLLDERLGERSPYDEERTHRAPSLAGEADGAGREGGSRASRGRRGGAP